MTRASVELWGRRIGAVTLQENASTASFQYVPEFVRSGNALATMEERISSDDGQIVLAWWDLLPAFVITVPPGQMNRPIGVYSTFFPARGAQLSVNGEAATAKPFAQDRSGKASSSCVLAWSETWVGPG